MSEEMQMDKLIKKHAGFSWFGFIVWRDETGRAESDPVALRDYLNQKYPEPATEKILSVLDDYEMK